MKKLNITKGEWKVEGQYEDLIVCIPSTDDSAEERICVVKRHDHHVPNYEEWEANAQLIAEAGTLYNETGKSPKQFQETYINFLRKLELEEFNHEKTKQHLKTMQKEIERLKTELSKSEKNYQSAVNGRKKFRSAFRKVKQQNEVKLEALKQIASNRKNLKVTWEIANKAINNQESQTNQFFSKESVFDLMIEYEKQEMQIKESNQRVEDLKEALEEVKSAMKSRVDVNYWGIGDLIDKALSGEESRNQKLEEENRNLRSHIENIIGKQYQRNGSLSALNGAISEARDLMMDLRHVFIG